MLYLGNLSKEVENTLFGINLILILILQEKDEVKGEIKYSLLPLIINNTYLFLANFTSYFGPSPGLSYQNNPASASPSSILYNRKESTSE